ncbi:MAG: PAS domain-containing protein [bacterium]|nr:PAS domain-containing protein [bacterium]
MPPDDLIQSEVLIHRHFSGVTDHYECDIRMKHCSGDWIWISDRGRVVERDAEGKPLRMTGTHVDVTESKKSGKPCTKVNRA